MAAQPYLWVGSLLAQVREICETDPRSMSVLAKRVGTCKRTLHRLIERHGWRRPPGARVHNRSAA